MKKHAPKKKPNPIAKGLSEFKPQVVKGKKTYARKPKHPKKQEAGD